MEKILLEYFLENGMSAVVGAAVGVGALAGVVGYITTQVRDSIRALADVKKTLKKMSNSEYDYSPIVFCDVDITEFVTKIRSTLAADRVLVLQYHNGEKSIADNPFLKLTCTHEVLARGCSSVQRAFSAVPMSMFGTWNSSMFEGQPVVLPHFSDLDEDPALRPLYQFLQPHHPQSMYVFPIQDVSGKTFGMGVVEYVDNAAVIDDADKGWAASRFQQVGALLTSRGG